MNRESVRKGGYSNPEMDRWLRKAEAALNEQEVIKTYQEAEKMRDYHPNHDYG